MKVMPGRIYRAKVGGPPGDWAKGEIIVSSDVCTGDNCPLRMPRRRMVHVTYENGRKDHWQTVYNVDYWVEEVTGSSETFQYEVVKNKECKCPTLLDGHHKGCPYLKVMS